MTSAIELVAEALPVLRAAFTDPAQAPAGGLMRGVLHMGGDQPRTPDCCDGPAGTNGWAWVRVLRVYPTIEFPAEQAELREAPCGVSTAVTIELGTVRCSMAMDDQGNDPSPEQYESEALVLLADAERLRSAAAQLLCGDDGYTGIIGSWEPRGPDGGCLGGSIIITATKG